MTQKEFREWMLNSLAVNPGRKFRVEGLTEVNFSGTISHISARTLSIRNADVNRASIRLYHAIIESTPGGFLLYYPKESSRCVKLLFVTSKGSECKKP